MRLGPTLCIVAAIVGASCSCQPSAGGLQLEVRFEGFVPACVELIASDANNPALTLKTELVSPEDRPQIVAVARPDGWSTSLSVRAVGHEGDCEGTAVASDDTGPVEIHLRRIETRTLTLSATDADHDGWVTDCDDSDRNVHPGATEACADSVDNDCNGSTDCGDPACAQVACDDGEPCTLDDRCTGAGCAGTPVVCGPPTAPCRAGAGACVADGGCEWSLAAVGTECDAGMACRNDGVCVSRNTELDCSDGVDNDGDMLIDCGDSDCSSVSCDAGLCTVSAVCTGAVCSGSPKQCPSALCMDAGTCLPATGACDSSPLPLGTPCVDGNPCTTSDTCNGAGACSGSPLTCAVQTCLTGACDAGTCVYTPAPGGTCDDTQACTWGDACNSSGLCSGTIYSCSTPPPCQMALGVGCLGDGGCAWTADVAQNGASCPGGTCQAGTCVPTPDAGSDAGADAGSDAGTVDAGADAGVDAGAADAGGGDAGGGADAGFPYAVANVDPASLPPGGGAIINCAVTVNTTDGGVTGNWCGGPAPSTYTVVQASSSEPAFVLSMSSLTITTAGSLRFVGSRPVVMLVFDQGVTSIDGVIDARALGASAGAGGDRPTCGGQIGGAGSWNFDTGSARGSGGGGAGFATRGGAGGTADSNAVPGGDGGAVGPASLSPIVGGCQGGRGGATHLNDGGVGGSGGGAVQLSVAGELQVHGTARLTVSGGGGRGGPNSSRTGGGGGGSGGGILLEANLLSLSSGAWLTSNGGGGGEAADADEPGNAGTDGDDNSGTPAAGGTGGSSVGGAGGAGAAGSTLPGAGVSTTTGGGGGGAAGRIHLRSAGSPCTRAGANLSPPPTNAGNCP